MRHFTGVFLGHLVTAFAASVLLYLLATFLEWLSL
jgi:hypothetical protein